MEAGWAETGLLLADEFGDGNVPAPKDIKRWWMKPMKCYRWGCGKQSHSHYPELASGPCPSQWHTYFHDSLVGSRPWGFTLDFRMKEVNND